MPQLTLGDIVDRLRNENEQLRTAIALLEHDMGVGAGQNLRDRVLVLEQKIEYLAKRSESWGTRLFQLLIVVLAAILGFAANTYLGRK